MHSPNNNYLIISLTTPLGLRLILPTTSFGKMLKKKVGMGLRGGAESWEQRMCEARDQELLFDMLRNNCNERKTNSAQ